MVNLPKKYNQLLELMTMNELQRTLSLKRIFQRDIEDNAFRFRGKKINPTQGQEEPLERLFKHLTTEVTDQSTRLREFEQKRSERLHWIRHHTDEKKVNGVLVFSVKESDQIRTYIFDNDEYYVVILEAYRNRTEYYLLTAYYLDGRNPEKINNKYRRRLPEIV